MPHMLSALHLLFSQNNNKVAKMSDEITSPKEFLKNSEIYCESMDTTKVKR